MAKVTLETNHKFAVEAPDCALHMENYENENDFEVRNLTFEVGAGGDFNSDVPFINEIIDRFPLEGDEKVSWLDLGCAGGGLILDANSHEKTDVCIGLDGSVGVYKQPSWNDEANKSVLRNADLSKEFFIKGEDGENFKFDIITCWEVLEHFYENQLEQFFQNVYEHLSDSGVFVGSIAFFEDIRDENGFGPGTPNYNPNLKQFQLHNTLKPQEWWDELMGKWFNIHQFDFRNRFRNADPRLNYYFTMTKKV